MATWGGVGSPFLVRPAGSGPFDFQEVQNNDDLIAQRDAYLTAVPNATEEQLESGLYTLDTLGDLLRESGAEAQARAVMALPFFDQDLIVSGGVGPSTRKVTDLYSGIDADALMRLASVGEAQIRREGIRDPSAADARRVIRDMKGASLAGAELLARERGQDAAVAYMTALEQAAAEIDTRKATKAQLASVARLLELPRPPSFRSWSQVPKSRLKDLLEDSLGFLLNPVPPERVAQTARGALVRRREAKGLRRGGTAVGIARARDLSNRRNLSDRTVNRMVSFFARHDTDAQRKARKDPMSPASVAWDLWGGDAGRRWAQKQSREQ